MGRNSNSDEQQVVGGGAGDLIQPHSKPSLPDLPLTFFIDSDEDLCRFAKHGELTFQLRTEDLVGPFSQESLYRNFTGPDILYVRSPGYLLSAIMTSLLTHYPGGCEVSLTACGEPVALTEAG